MKIVLENKDFNAIRQMVIGYFGIVLTDAQIQEIIVEDSALIGLAYQYGWDETETRSQLFDRVYSTIMEEDFVEDDMCFDKLKTTCKKMGITVV